MREEAQRLSQGDQDVKLIERFPQLRQILEDLAYLGEEDVPAPRGQPKIEAGRDLARVTWPGLGQFWLTAPQLRIVRELLAAALDSASPDVDQDYLIRASGSACRRLADVFRGSQAWGKLVLAGERAGSYRVASAT